MKKTILLLSVLGLVFTTQIVNAQLINPNFEVWTNDMLVPSAMNPNNGNNTFGWWDFNMFNYSLLGSSPISVTRCSDTVQLGSYSARIQTQAYTPTSWNIYKSSGIPFIGHDYNDTLGILFNGKVNATNQSFNPGTACTQKITEFKFYYQYKPVGNDTAECRVELVSAGNPVAGGWFKTGVATGNSGWQLATVSMTYVSAATPDTLYILFSSSSLDYKPYAGSVLWIDNTSVTLPVGTKQTSKDENNFTIFPNPNKGIFSIQQLSNSTTQSIEIFNILGEKIYSGFNKNNISTIDISSSPKGLYYVKLNDGTNITSRKIIVQ